METFNGTSALGFQWDTRECIFDSQGDTIEGSVSNRFLEDPVLNLAKNEFGSFEATIPYQINTAFGSYKNPVYTNPEVRENRGWWWKRTANRSGWVM